MILVICRHAKSDWGDASLSDFDRPLNKRGMKNSKAMGAFLQTKDISFDLLISSSALRARTTAKRVADGINYPAEDIVLDNDLYLAGVTTILERIEKLAKGKQNVLVFGHNPGFTELVNHFGVRLDNLPTNGMVAFELEGESWDKLYKQDAKYLWHQFPKML